MRLRGTLLIMLLLTLALGVGVGRLSAGTLGSVDSPGDPASDAAEMYTLEEIYNRLSEGAAATKQAFQEPGSGPGTGTMYTLDQIMAVARPGALAPRVNKTGQTDCFYDDGATGTCPCGGATHCPFGQDGYFEMGVDPAIAPTPGASGGYNAPVWTGVRFTDNGDGTMTDNLTALIWLKDASCSSLTGTNPNGMGDWATAFLAAYDLADGVCGLSDGSSAGDWRLPNANELHSLIDLTQSNPALPDGHHFDGPVSDGYWSSTTRADDTWLAWAMNLGNGHQGGVLKSVGLYIWPVRGGQ